MMSSNSIILSGIFSRFPNDVAVLRELEAKIKRNLKILDKLQTEYGERWNNGRLKELFMDSDVFCDSGFDGEENNEFITTSTINFIVYP